jgi:hypothetical protein
MARILREPTSGLDIVCPVQRQVDAGLLPIDHACEAEQRDLSGRGPLSEWIVGRIANAGACIIRDISRAAEMIGRLIVARRRKCHIEGERAHRRRIRRRIALLAHDIAAPDP